MTLVRGGRTRRPRRARLGLGVLLMMMSVGGSARAQSATDEARRLYEEGRGALQAKRFDEACDKLAQSYRLSGSAGALLLWADCEESRGRLATALDLWKQGSAKVATDPSRRDFAEQRIAALDPRVPRVVLQQDQRPYASLVVRIDGQPVDVARQPFLVDPGDHELTAEANGVAPQRTPFRAMPAQTVTLVLFPNAGSSFGSATTTTTEPLGAGRDTSSDGTAMRTAGWIAVGLGVAGAVAFGITGALVLDKCDGDLFPCGGVDPTPEDTQTALNPLFVVNAISFGLGVLGLGGGAVLIAVAPTGPANAGTSTGGGTPRAPSGFTLRVGSSF